MSEQVLPPEHSVTESTAETVEEVRPKSESHFGVLKIAIALIFFLLFAYDVWEVIESTLEFSQHLNLQVVHWVVLVCLMIAPLLIWGLAVLVGRRLSALKFALVLLVGWAVSAQVFLSLNYVLQLLFLGMI